MIDFSITPNDFISLFTSLDNGYTRSVYCCKRVGKLILIDNITFDLIISLSHDISIDQLEYAMLKSYTFIHFNNYLDNLPEKGLNQNEYDNPCLSRSMREIFTNIDNMNRSEFELYSEKQQNGYIYIDPQYSFKVIKNITQLMNSNKTKRRFPYDNQFKITFDNHFTLLYFFNRFKSRPFKIEGQEFQIKVLNPNQLDQLYNEKSSGEFISNRLIKFNHKNDFINFKFKTSIHIKEGLLHPSAVDILDNNQNKVLNIYENMIPSLFFRTVKNVRLNEMGYNTIYIDLSKINNKYEKESKYNDEDDDEDEDEEEEEKEVEIILVNYNDKITDISLLVDRTFNEKKKKTQLNEKKEEVIDENNSVSTKTPPLKRSTNSQSLILGFMSNKKEDPFINYSYNIKPTPEPKPTSTTKRSLPQQPLISGFINKKQKISM
jgi:hypothetical protein